jgi:hypothetical protein
LRDSFAASPPGAGARHTRGMPGTASGAPAQSALAAPEVLALPPGYRPRRTPSAALLPRPAPRRRLLLSRPCIPMCKSRWPAFIMKVAGYSPSLRQQVTVDLHLVVMDVERASREGKCVWAGQLPAPAPAICRNDLMAIRTQVGPPVGKKICRTHRGAAGDRERQRRRINFRAQK